MAKYYIGYNYKNGKHRYTYANSLEMAMEKARLFDLDDKMEGVIVAENGDGYTEIKYMKIRPED